MVKNWGEELDGYKPNHNKEGISVGLAN